MQYTASGSRNGSIADSTPVTAAPTYQQSVAFFTWHSAGSTRFNNF